MKLLGNMQTNHKIRKSGGKGYLIWSLTLRPSNLSGFNVCPHATPGCRAACVLEHAGHSNFESVKLARDRKTARLFEYRVGFLSDLHSDIESATWTAKRADLDCAVRLNTASDIVWERLDPSLFTGHNTVTFYDYTKHPKRRGAHNYHLTYSAHETSNPANMRRILESGGNVAMVFDTEYNPAHHKIGKLPGSRTIDGKRFLIVDGDAHDLRIPKFDGRGHIIGLRGKGGRAIVEKGVADGFIIHA